MRKSMIALGILLLTSACSTPPGHTFNLSKGGVDVTTLSGEIIELSAPESTSASPYPPTIRALDISSNNKLLVVIEAGFNVNDEKVFRHWLEFYELDGGRLERSEVTEELVLATKPAGFLGAQNYFLATRENQSTDNSQSSVTIYDLDSHIALKRLLASPVIDANSNYVLTHDSTLINWRTDETFDVDLYRQLTYATLTDGGYVLTVDPGDGILRHHPVSDVLESWGSGIGPVTVFSSAEDKYVVAQGRDFKCRVWRFPGRERTGSCDSGLWETAEIPSSAMHPSQQMAALAWDNTIRVYNLDPFELTLELKTEEVVKDLHWTEEQLVILTDHEVRLWDLHSNQVTAHSFLGEDEFIRDSWVSPDRTRLVIRQTPRVPREDGIQQLTVYQLP